MSLKIFFDESGKRDNKPNIMGGLAIPSVIYELDDFQLLTQQLREGQMRLHFNQYSGHLELKKVMSDVILVLCKF